MKFSENLKKLRSEKGMTQKELADKLYISRSAVAKWEQGRGYPSLEMLEKLSEIFQISIDDLLSEKEFRSMTIACDQRTKTNARLNRIILIGGCLILVAILCLFILFFSLKSKKIDLYNFEFYATVNVEENGLKFTSIDCHYGFFEETDIVFLKNSELDELTVYDKYGKGLNASELRSGERVLVSYTSKKDYRLQEMNIYHIDVIDDYLEGDYYSYGFFISTEAVDYEKPPIYDSDSGYDESVLKWQGEAHP